MWDSLLDHIAKRPWASAIALITYFLVVVGVIEARQILTQEFGEVSANVVVVVVIVLASVLVLFVSPLMDAFAPYVRSRSHGYTYSFVEQHWHLAANGSRNVRVTRHFVFHKEPTEEDLCDIVFGSLGLTLETVGYSTPDATVSRVDQSRPDAIRYFWKPKDGPIELGQIYKHTCSWSYPAGETPYEKSFTIASRVPCFDFRLRITTDRPIRDVVIRRASTRIKFWENIRIFADRSPSHTGMIAERTDNLLLVQKKTLRPRETYFVLVYV